MPEGLDVCRIDVCRIAATHLPPASVPLGPTSDNSTLGNGDTDTPGKDEIAHANPQEDPITIPDSLDDSPPSPSIEGSAVKDVQSPSAQPISFPRSLNAFLSHEPLNERTGEKRKRPTEGAALLAVKAFQELWPRKNFFNDIKWLSSEQGDAYVFRDSDLLINARVYILADRNICKSLIHTSLYHLKGALQCYVLEKITSLMEVVRVLYGGTRQNDPARILVSAYIGCFYERIRHLEPFEEVYLEEADFRHDLQNWLDLRLAGGGEGFEVFNRQHEQRCRLALR
ncbi:hypothetical protein FOQG_18856 [Fusarium oxysporum f. sp. raphani 54005]|uniref:Uncharacterized protein n=1 Tax=Fusarium oxysporum f. sp. raphani 54005 TaxID=1089458 RepID=X0C0S0_FUSOX|nr:hypothetical protein FOQG_18856 [Fusarium oxysporum f. sp. raphani 54005]